WDSGEYQIQGALSASREPLRGGIVIRRAADDYQACGSVGGSTGASDESVSSPTVCSVAVSGAGASSMTALSATTGVSATTAVSAIAFSTTSAGASATAVADDEVEGSSKGPCVSGFFGASAAGMTFS